MRRRWMVRAIVVAIVPMALAAACGTSGFKVDDAGVPPTDAGATIRAELYPWCTSRSAVSIDRPADGGALTPEGALTSFLATPKGMKLQGNLFEPAQPPRSYQPVQSVPADPTTSGPGTTSPDTLSSPQWFARHDQLGRVTVVIEAEHAADGWAVTGVYACKPTRAHIPTQTTFAFYPSGPSGSP